MSVVVHEPGGRFELTLIRSGGGVQLALVEENGKDGHFVRPWIRTSKRWGELRYVTNNDLDIPQSLPRITQLWRAAQRAGAFDNLYAVGPQNGGSEA